MNFREATDAFLANPRTHGTLARSMVVSESSIRAARLPEGASGHRKPPPGWEEALTALALSEADRMRALALSISRAVERYAEGGLEVLDCEDRSGQSPWVDVGGTEAALIFALPSATAEAKHGRKSGDDYRRIGRPVAEGSRRAAAVGLGSVEPGKRTGDVSSSGSGCHFVDDSSAFPIPDAEKVLGKAVERATMEAEHPAANTSVEDTVAILPRRTPFPKEAQTRKPKRAK